MASSMRIALIFLVICIQTIWTIRVSVPEYTSNRNEFMDTLEMSQKQQQQQFHKSQMEAQNPLLRQQSSVKYHTNYDGTVTTTTFDATNDENTAGANTHSQINAMHAQTSQQKQQQQQHHQRRHHTSYDKNDDVVTTSGGVSSTSPSTSSMHNHEANENSIENIEHNSRHIAGEHTTHQHSRPKRELSDWLIAPNTRWCGRGNLANGTYNTLGGASMADKCCRKHDHCKIFIAAMSQRYGLFNYRPYTLSHCSCDRRFRTCLKMANDEDAKTIGQLFFNMVQTQCFVLAKERVCLERAANGTCVQEQIKQKAHLRNNKKF